METIANNPVQPPQQATVEFDTRWKSATYSYVFPGLGQIVCEQKILGGILFAVALISMLGMFAFFFLEGWPPLVAIILWCLWISLFLIAPAVGFLMGRFRDKQTGATWDQERVNAYRSPYCAALLHLIIPGLGELFLRRYVRGIVYILLYFILTTGALMLMEGLFFSSEPDVKTMTLMIVFAASNFIVTLFRIVAIRLAFFCRQSLPVQNDNRLLWAIILFSFILPVVLVCGFSYDKAYKQKSDYSIMFENQETYLEEVAKDSIKPGEKMLLKKVDDSYVPKRNDLIAVYIPERDPGFIGLRRIVAVPGDRVEYQTGSISINGQTIKLATQIEKLKAKDNSRDDYPEVIPEGVLIVALDKKNLSRGACMFFIPKKMALYRVLKVWWPMSSARCIE